nr:uncharacterized protein LOC111413719 isoform X2 [Onthophagus taurus]
MLKWTVINKRATDKDDLQSPQQPKSSEKPKRRRSSTSRRSSTTKRSNNNHNRRSLNLSHDKENRFTSTPIKSNDYFQVEALRDVSNITPKETKTKVLSVDGEKLFSPKHVKYKKKKRCLDPNHKDCPINYFKAFESVDSHIRGDNCLCNDDLNKNVHENIKNDVVNRIPLLSRILPTTNNDDPPYKKPKIDHVNDFLNQIAFIQSPEDKGTIDIDEKDLKVSPLVQRFLDLRFSKKDQHENSSYINELSLDELVNVILDNSGTNDDKKHPVKKTRMIELENELNESREENLLNAKQEKRISFSDKSSMDSGFRSNFDEICKLPEIINCDKTIINLEETFNERCVDDIRPRSRKRSLSQDDASLFTLKRQKCVRRRRFTDDEAKPSSGWTPQRLHQDLNATFSINDDVNDDNSFDSSVMEKDLGNKKDLIETTPCFNNGTGIRRCLLFDSPPNQKNNSISGWMDLEIKFRNNELLLTVFRCGNLFRSDGKPANAYIKVSLSQRDNRKGRGTLQRTAVQAESNKPTFNHTFNLAVLRDEDVYERVYIEVWHRDRIRRKSEFLGCMSFAAENVITKDVKGCFYLLPQSTGRCKNVPMTLDILPDYNPHLDKTMCDSHSSIDEVATAVFTTGEDLEDLRKTTIGCKAALSEQQKLADENLFLRYLELDPTEGPEAIPAALQRKATGNKNGRTPFTTTKKLMRQPKTGFGFSVVWTHPPRIERVEKGLPADKAGILPGDYVIFVDKHNVVMMPEIDILNLIRSYGNQLTLEIFRRNSSRNGSVPSVKPLMSFENIGGGLPAPSLSTQRRPSTVCSTTNTASVDYSRKKLQLPQITFNSEKLTSNIDDSRKKSILQLISKEQQYATGLQFAITRFVSALAERKDLVTQREHKVLFQNCDELLHITEEILEHLVQEDGDSQVHILPKIYFAKLSEMTSAYKKYCSGIKKSDCVLANKLKNSNSEFVRFIQVPAIPRRRPDITAFIHKPLEHFRDVLKSFNVILSQTKPNHEDYAVISQIVHDLQITYREITSEGGMMEPIGEGRPLLSVQDLENRLVFTKCKPFVLSKPGRQWIFGGDLSRVEGRNVRQYWALLFTDILLFAKVSRDRVLFIFEDPLPLSHITDLTFNVRKKVNEFRITVEPGGKTASSPTVHCGPDLSRTPRKNPNKKCILLRAPTTELKAVWQNLLQRQIFHVSAVMDGSAFSSPLESPDVPITSSVVTLQSADSLSIRRQNIRLVKEKSDSQKHIDELIEHKCKQLGKSATGHKGSAIHLEQWMKGHLGTTTTQSAQSPEEENGDFEVWTEEMLRKRSAELQIVLNQKNTMFRCESALEEINISESDDHSPSKSTTSESQVTVRSSPVVPETLSVCRQCHRTCLTNQNGTSIFFPNNNQDVFGEKIMTQSNDDLGGGWRPLVLMGLTAMNPARSLITPDPFAAPVPKISIVPPTPDLTKKVCEDNNYDKTNCNCTEGTNQTNNDNSPDSPQTEDQPYHSLNSSNLTLRRYGTVSSLERVGSDEIIEEEEEANDNSSEEDDDEVFEENQEKGFYNEAFNNSGIRGWTARAGSFVAEKMSFLERLGEDYKVGSRFFERYLRSSEIQVNGEDGQEEETSGATSGEDVWGTPTSGGELDDPLSSPLEGRRSPNDGSLSSNDDNTELMMDELLMTPPVTSAAIRGLLPRRTLEPLMEEEYSDTYTSSSSSSSSERGQTDPSGSPEQDNGTGSAADKCSTAAERDTPSVAATASDFEELNVQRREAVVVAESSSCSSTPLPRIQRSDSYRHIIDQEDENPNFFARLKPTVKFVNIERIPRSKGIKLLEFFNMKRERKIHESFTGAPPMINMYSREDFFDEVEEYDAKPISTKILKDKQIDRRFWKQLNKRRNQKPLQLSA